MKSAILVVNNNNNNYNYHKSIFVIGFISLRHLMESEWKLIPPPPPPTHTQKVTFVLESQL